MLPKCDLYFFNYLGHACLYELNHIIVALFIKFYVIVACTFLTFTIAFLHC